MAHVARRRQRHRRALDRRARHAMHGHRVTLVTKDVLEHAQHPLRAGRHRGVMFADDRAERPHPRHARAPARGSATPRPCACSSTRARRASASSSRFGVAFDRDDDGASCKGLEAAHSVPAHPALRRRCHRHRDREGPRRAAAARATCACIEHAFLIDLVGAEARRRRRAAGRRRCVVGHLHAAAVASVDADAVVLATGGAGELYAHTTNPRSRPATASPRRCARAPRWPTSSSSSSTRPLLADARATPFLVSEAVRGEGATLHRRARPPLRVRRAPRRRARPARRRRPGDRAADGRAGRPSRASSTRPASARRTRRREFLARRFPTIDRAVRDRGLDWAREPDPGDARRALPDGRRRDRPRRAHDACPASTPSARSPAPACTARTGWRRTRCSRAPCSAPGRATRSRADAASRQRWPAPDSGRARRSGDRAAA